MTVEEAMRSIDESFRNTVIEYAKQQEQWFLNCITIYSADAATDMLNLMDRVHDDTWVRVNPLIDPAFDYPEPWLTYLSYKGQAVAVLDERSIRRIENTLGTMYHYVPDQYVKECPIPIDKRATEEAWKAKVDSWGMM